MAGDVPPEIEDRLRAICGSLPDAYEEEAWVGVRWRVRKRTFAQACAVDPGDATSHAVKVLAPDEPLNVLTFRVPDDDVAGLVASGYPFYPLCWGTNVVGMVLGTATDWEEVEELLTDSYRIQAPKKLSRLLDAPPGPGGG
jgi:hypothetical protein